MWLRDGPAFVHLPTRISRKTLPDGGKPEYKGPRCLSRYASPENHCSQLTDPTSGNICRSPMGGAWNLAASIARSNSLAEAVLRSVAKSRGLDIEVDSCGTGITTLQDREYILNICFIQVHTMSEKIQTIGAFKSCCIALKYILSNQVFSLITFLEPFRHAKSIKFPSRMLPASLAPKTTQSLLIF